VVALATRVAIFDTAIIRYAPRDNLRVVVGFLRVVVGFLRVVVGFLRVVFRLKWLKKSILRSAGLTALHGEEAW
jgi:uncharacterized membrane protein